MKNKFLFLMLLPIGVSCSKSESFENANPTQIVLTAEGRNEGSVVAGNLMATAIKQQQKVDIVLYPSALLNASKDTLLDLDKVEQNKSEILAFYPTGKQDQFIIGYLSGRDIKKFLYQRANLTYSTDLQTAGIKYNFKFLAGMPSVNVVTGEKNQEIQDRKKYSVAISSYFYEGIFPGYMYGNGMNFSLKQEKIVSARESLSAFLDNSEIKDFDISDQRVRVETISKDFQGLKTIAEIQGTTHISPLHGHKIKTVGVVTTVAAAERFPGGIDMYIQSSTPDDNDLTSDGVHVYLNQSTTDVKVGDLIEINATVYETVANNSMLSKTSLRDVTNITVKRKNVTLPKAVELSAKGRIIPSKTISSFNGDLNQKPVLNLEDGIDFWESLEGMRITFDNPRIVGFSGGNAEAVEGVERYLTMYMIPEFSLGEGISKAGGVVLQGDVKNYHSNIIQVTTSHLTQGVKPDFIVKVGDQLKGKVTGIMGYERNTFGDSEYTLLFNDELDVFKKSLHTKIPDLLDRPKTDFVSTDKNLTVATYNMENLAANAPERIALAGSVIKNTLKCPDIMNLVEVQDNNGTDFSGSSKADQTLDRIIRAANCSFEYKAINIDPRVHSEGGQPGGNIRVAMLYNSEKLGFDHKQPASNMTETMILPTGDLNVNPGRVFPNDPVFDGGRPVIIAQFSYKGEKIFVLGGHFKSKLGDGSSWTNIQPPPLDSDKERAETTLKVNQFVSRLESIAPESNIIVLGDFNAYHYENSMKALEGSVLQNLMTYQDLVPENEWYTISFGGVSQAIDFIFANKNLLQKNPKLEILHINTDYMKRTSDHDPVIAEFIF